MVRFKVEKMGCGSCAKFDARVVQGVEPTTGVDVDPGAKLVSVSDVTGSADRIARAIAEAGYSAEPARGPAQPNRVRAVPRTAGRTSVPARNLASWIP